MHNHDPLPSETEVASDLAYIDSLPPRLRTSEDSTLRSEFAFELQRIRSNRSTTSHRDKTIPEDVAYGENEKSSTVEPESPAASAGMSTAVGGSNDSEPEAKENDAVVPPHPPHPGHVDPPPDGGLAAWLTVIGSAFSILCVLGLVTGAGQLQAFYLKHQLSIYSTSTVAWIASTQITLTFGGAVISGALFDAYSARPLVVASTLGQVGSLVALAFSNKYYQIMLSHAAFGVSGAIVYSPATGIAAHWFLRRRGTAVAVIMSGAGAGGVIYPLLIKALTDHFRWRDAILILAACQLAFMTPGCLFMRKRLPNRPPAPLSALKRPWKDVRYCFLVVGQSMTSMAVFSPYFNAAAYARGSGIEGYAVTILQAGNFVGRIASGPLADWIGTWRVFVSFAALSAVWLFAFFVADMGTAATVVGLAGYGLASGGHITLIPAVTATISPAHEIGLRIGLLWTVLAIPMLIVPVISGELIQRGGGEYKWAGVWNGLQFVLSSSILGAPGTYLWWKERRGRKAQA